MDTSLIVSSALSKIPPDVTFKFPKSTSWTIPSQRRRKELKEVEKLATTFKKRKIEDMNDQELPFETPKNEKVSCHLCGRTLINQVILDYHVIHCNGGNPKNSRDSMDSLFNGENDKIPGPVIEDISEDGDEGASETETDSQIEFDGDEIEANKTILAMVSEVFGNMFFVHNTKDKSAAEIVLEDTTKPPFQIMLDAINDVKPMKESLREKSVDEMFAVLYLVSKYEIPKLILAVKECLSSFPINEDNVLEVASDAFEYSNTFEEAAQILLDACAKFIKFGKFGGGDSFIRFVAENGDRMATVQKLAVLMADMSPADWCDGCQRKITECLNGKSVTAVNVKAGAKVVSKYGHRVVGHLVKKDAEDHWFILWENDDKGNYVDIGNGDQFLFKCR